MNVEITRSSLYATESLAGLTVRVWLTPEELQQLLDDTLEAVITEGEVGYGTGRVIVLTTDYGQ